MEMTYDGAMVMPANFVVVDEEEMEYLDGGGLYMSYDTLLGVASAICANPYSISALAASVKYSAIYIACKIGIYGTAIGAIVGVSLGTWMISQATTFAERTFTALTKHKGCEFTIGWHWRVVPVLEGTIR